MPLLFLIGTLSGCSGEEIKKRTADRLEWLDQKLGENSPEQDTPTTTSSQDEDNKKIEASDLTRKQKNKIDEWLEGNNLNRYGDSEGAIYSDGTPLYNRETGEKIGRFEYILDRYPDILERINNSGQ